MKCYYIMLSSKFPKSHVSAGDSTNFNAAIAAKIKIHTIRANFDYWKKCIGEINAGNAYLSLRVWEGKPYRSKQIEIQRIENASIQYIFIDKYCDDVNAVVDGKKTSLEALAANDGLTYENWIRWFFPDTVKHALFKGAIIHFTNFKYT